MIRRTVVVGTALLALFGHIPGAPSGQSRGLPGAACALLSPVGACAAAEKPGYLSQTYIDTVIQRAYESFTIAMEEAATEVTQETAIYQAKIVVDRLKRLAEKDPNRKYILWKVSELEYQIFLEERDLVRQTAEQNVGRLNELADAFNREVGRERPDFVKLKSLQEEFAALSEDKGQEIEVLISRRSATVGRQVSAQIQAALAKGDIETARRGLDYCYANRGILAVLEKQMEQFTASLQSRAKLTDQRRFVEEDMRTAQKAITAGDFRTAWSTLGLIDRRLGDISKELPPQQLRAYQSKRQRMAMDISVREDSLVDAAIALYNTKGRTAAREYVESVLRAAGVSREKLAVVDDAIVGDAAASASQQKDVNPELRRVFVDLADDPTEGSSDMLGELTRKAKIRAQEREDSAMAAQAEAEMSQQAAYQKEHRREIRAQERADRKRSKQRQVQLARQERTEPGTGGRDQTMAEERRKAELALAQREQSGARAAQAPDSDQRNRALAQQNIVLIYNLLEQNLAQAAYDRFILLRDPLRDHLAPEVYGTLESAVLAAYREAGGTE